jgi:hypothetical protein
MTDKPTTTKSEKRFAVKHVKLTAQAHKALSDYRWKRQMTHSEAIIDMLKKIKAVKK